MAARQRAAAGQRKPGVSRPCAVCRGPFAARQGTKPNGCCNPPSAQRNFVIAQLDHDDVAVCPWQNESRFAAGRLPPVNARWLWAVARIHDTVLMAERIGRMAQTPKVALLIETARGYGRRDAAQELRGYAHLHGPWGFYVTPGDFGQALPKMRQWGGTGIIARIETARVARAILDSGLPAIALDLSELQLRPGPSIVRFERSGVRFARCREDGGGAFAGSWLAPFCLCGPGRSRLVGSSPARLLSAHPTGRVGNRISTPRRKQERDESGNVSNRVWQPGLPVCPSRRA